MKKRVFEYVTLFFLLSVIVAIAMPVYAGSYRSGASTACMSNMKQIGLAALMYSADHNDRFPSANHWESEALIDYTKNRELYCPSAPGHRFGYAMNRAMSGINTTKIKEPAKQLAFFESAACLPDASGSEQLMPRPGRHRGRNTVVYVDGSAKRIDPLN